MDNKLILGVIFIFSLLISVFLTSGTTNCGGSTKYTTCNTYGCINITDSSNDLRAVFDGGGFIDIEGSLTEASVGTPDGNDFIIQDSGASTVLWIDDATGNLRRYRENARKQLLNYVEAYLECPLEVCMQREAERGKTFHAPKQIYKRAQEGKAPTVPGIGEPYEPPLNPEVTIDTAKHTPEQAAQQILNTTLKRY